MLNITAIQDGLKNLVGFEGLCANPALTANLTKTESGLYVERVHPLITIDNIINLTKVPSNNIEDYLTGKRKASIANLFNRLYVEKQLNGTAKELLSEVRLYDGSGNFSDKIVKTDRFVGFRVTMKEADVSLAMRMIGLQFDSANEKLKIYVYHSSQATPVNSFELNYDKPNSFLWKQFENKVDLPNIEGGSYVIGYYEKDVIGQAIDRQQVFGKMPACSSCNAINYGYYQKWFKHVSVQPMYVESSKLNDDYSKWNESDEHYVDGTNFGLNLALSVVCDMTPMLIRIREVFSYALSLQIACDILYDMAYSVRDNQSQQKIGQLAMYALNNEEEKEGMYTRLNKAIKALDFNVSDINKICLPCSDNASRMTYKSVY